MNFSEYGAIRRLVNIPTVADAFDILEDLTAFRLALAVT